MSRRIYGYGSIEAGKCTKRELIDLMKEYDVAEEDVRVESCSDSSGDKPKLQEILAIIEPGDLVIIKNISELGNSYDDVIKSWTYITKTKKVDIKVIDTPILDTRTAKDLLGTAMTDIVVTLLTYVVENNKEYQQERKRIQSEGIAAAQEKGVHFGRRKRPLPDNFVEVVKQWRAGEISVDEAAQMCGMAKSTFYSRAKEVD